MMKQSYILVEGIAWCCLSLFYSRKMWQNLLVEIASFYHEYKKMFHYFAVYFSDEQGEHIKITFSSDTRNIIEVQEIMNSRFLFFLKENPSIHPKKFPFGEELWSYHPNNTLVWNQYKIRYPNVDYAMDEQFMFCLFRFMNTTYGEEDREQIEEENFKFLEQLQQEISFKQNGVNLAKWGCLIECLAQQSLIRVDVDEQLVETDDFLATLWQKMKGPYIGTYQFLLWIGDYFLFRFCDKESRFHSRSLQMLEQIISDIGRSFCKSEYRVKCGEPLFLFPVDVWRDLVEWLLHVEKVCVCESVKNVLKELYAIPEIEILLHCDFPKDALRWNFREMMVIDKRVR